MAEIFEFPAKRTSRGRPLRQTRRGTRVNIRTLCFRSYDLIVESDEALLIRDVSLDIHKAQVKLRKVKQRLKGVKEWSAAQIQLLTAADTKLSAAIVAAQENAKSPVNAIPRKPGRRTTPAQLAELVRTLPEAQQQKIEAVIDFLLGSRE